MGTTTSNQPTDEKQRTYLDPAPTPAPSATKRQRRAKRQRVKQSVNRGVPVNPSLLVLHEQKTGVGSFGTKRFPQRLLAKVLGYAGPVELARSQAVCAAWRGIDEALLNRPWELLYTAKWEAGSGDSKAIAAGGPYTPWSVRYQRRTATERNWRSGEFRQAQHLPPCAVVCSATISDSLIALGLMNGELALFDTELPGVVKTVKAQHERVASVAHGGGLVFADCGGAGLVQAWRLPELTLERQFLYDPSGAQLNSASCMASDGRLLVAGFVYSRPDNLVIWDVETGKERARVKLGDQPMALAVDFKACIAYVAVFRIGVWAVSLSKGQPLHSPLTPWAHNLSAQLHLRPAFRDLLVTLSDGSLRIELDLDEGWTGRDGWDRLQCRYLCMRSPSRSAVCVGPNTNSPGVVVVDPETNKHLYSWQPQKTQSGRQDFFVATVTKLIAFGDRSTTMFDFSPA